MSVFEVTRQCDYFPRFGDSQVTPYKIRDELLLNCIGSGGVVEIVLMVLAAIKASDMHCLYILLRLR